MPSSAFSPHPSSFSESVVEDAALEYFAELGYTVAHGPDLAPDEAASERANYGDVVLIDRLRAALNRINPKIPAETIDEAVRKVLNIGHESPSLFENNRRFHKLLADGLDVEYRRPDGSIAGDKVWLIDFENVANNDWLAVNQFTIIEDKNNRQPDVVIFVNGLPLGVVELKNPADETATIKHAFNQLQTYKHDIPSLFPYNEILVISDGLEVRAAFSKAISEEGRTINDLDTAIRQIVSRAVASEEVVDIFAAAGLKTPDISILSDEFLAEVRDLPQKNLALELLKKLINDEIRSQSRKNLVQSRSFAEMLERTIRQYQNRSLEAAQVITELIKLAKEMRAAHRRGEDLGLSEEELAFYDALEVNDSAVKVLGDETLRTIARELVETVRRNVTIDWTLRESVRANLRRMVKRVLRRYGYPPDKQEKATQTVLEQAELIAKDWAE